jgi:hypothetical protein
MKPSATGSRYEAVCFVKRRFRFLTLRLRLATLGVAQGKLRVNYAFVAKSPSPCIQARLDRLATKTS